MTILRGVRSLASVLFIGLWFLLGSLALRLLVVPACWLMPARRTRIAGDYMKVMSAGILALLRFGGARVRRRGRVDTGAPVFVVANHQSLTDILQTALLSRPLVPGFVTRTRYERWVPLVSTTARLLGSPFIDPRRDPSGAVARIERAAREAQNGLLIFPEGHRSRDGSILPFRGTGLETMLRTRRLPVWLVLNDGVHRVASFADLLFRVHLIDAYSEAMGPFAAPPDPSELPDFVRDLRARLVARLEEHRREDAASGRAA
jgi:1-acyl-sn-glycerol-3-phosphate acyltransferase